MIEPDVVRCRDALLSDISEVVVKKGRRYQGAAFESVFSVSVLPDATADDSVSND